MRPDISIIIPTRNRREFLSQALHSCAMQEGVTAEILVIDDGSTDDTPAYCRILGTRIRYLKNSGKGPAAARNEGMRVARGEFIKFLDDDDVLAPHSLQSVLQSLQKSSADICFAPWQFCTEEGIPFGSLQGSKEMEPTCDFIATGWWYPGFAYTFRQSFLQEHQCMWDESSYFLADFSFILECVSRAPHLVWDSAVSGYYRRHNGSTQLSQIPWEEREMRRIEILRDAEERLHAQIPRELIRTKCAALTTLYR